MDFIIGGARGPKGGAPSSPNANPAGPIKDASLETFAADVIEASMQVPVIVDFWAPWCGPCKQLTPVLERLVTAAKGAVRLVKVNIDENPEIAQQLRIQSVPTVYAFKNGQPVDGFAGALPESQLKAFIDRLTGGAGGDPLDEAFAELAQMVEAGNFAHAAQGYGALMQEAPGDPRAIAGLAQCYLGVGDLKRAEDTLALTPPDARADAAIVAVQAALALAKEAAQAGNPAELEARVAADPKDWQARYDLALALVAKGRREDAVEHLLTIIKNARAWNEDAARKKLLTLFEAFGPNDPLTLAGRRKLSAILFS